MLASTPDAMGQRPKAPYKPPKCDCKHIEEIEKNIGDYRWLAEAHGRKAAELEAKEVPLIKKWGSAARNTEEMDAIWDDYGKWQKVTLREEFAKARNYPSTTAVTFDESTNKPDPRQLEKARNESACLRIADSIDRHEKGHSDVRTSGRGQHERPSKLALEEKTHYEDGMKFLQEEVDSLKGKKKCREPKSEAYGSDSGQRYAQRERMRRAVNRVSSYAAAI